MPLLRLQTSAAVPQDRRDDLLFQLSATTAKLLAKPESFMMVVLDDNRPMLMGGAAEPAAFVEIRSVGTISAAQAQALSASIGEIVAGVLAVPANRIYSNFLGVPGAMWGFDGKTFG